MNPLCPGCLREMATIELSRNMFRCEPCREMIKFFDVQVHEFFLKKTDRSAREAA
jgi:tRNA(Ile2) C34 agmatinyltransferase TiaS